MLKFLTALTAYLLMVCCCFAQQKDTTANGAHRSNELMIKFAPLSILDYDGGLNFSVEYFISKLKLGFQLEAQPIFFDIYGSAGESGLDKPQNVLQSGPVHGIKLRPEIRYYTDILKGRRLVPRPNSHQTDPGQETRRQARTRTYFAVAFLYKQTLQQRTNEFYISNGGTQQAEYTDVKQVTAFEFKMGVLKPLKNEHWFTDVYFGFGIRIRKLSYRNLPPGAYEPSRGGSLIGGPGTSSERIPSLPIGIRITYKL